MFKQKTFMACMALLLVTSLNNLLTAEDDILTTAAANGSFNTLVSLVTAANLDEALQADGEFTVFAPTDEAFARLPAELRESLLKPENRDRLASLLKYHVLAQEVSVPKKAPRHRLRSAQTLSQAEIEFSRRDGSVFVNESRIVTRNIRCSNGLIHVIDAVLFPPDPAKNIPAVAAEAGSFKTLLAAVQAAGLLEALNGEGPFTVFAPTDRAFKQLPAGTVEDLLKDENRDQLTAILKYHVVSGSISAQQAAAAGAATTLQGDFVSIRIQDGQLCINDAKVIANDVAADNGIIHVIDSVLLPGQDNDSSQHDAESASAATSDDNQVVTIRASWDDRIVRDGIVADTIEISASGGGTVRLTNVKARQIKTGIGGGSSVTLSGSVDSHEARVSGGSSLRAAKLESRTTTMTVAGGGNASINATELLDVGANGGAVVQYVKTEAKIKKRINKYASFREISDSH